MTVKLSEKQLHYNLIFRSEPEGGFTVMVPALPGCVTYGRTLETAKKMARDAIRAYIMSLRKHGEQAPTDAETFIASVELEYVKTA